MLFLLLLCSGFQAQVASLSPYSRFALGALQTQGTTLQRGMGGISAASLDQYSVNGFNPASYSFLRRTVYSVDLRATRLALDDGAEQIDLYGGGLNTVQFGFKNEGGLWGFGLGLRPFSSSGYDISILEEDTEVGDVQKTYAGDGGLNTAHAGVSRAFPIQAKTGLLQKATVEDTLSTHHIVSVGANLEYFFGQLATTRRVLFSEPGYYDTRIQTETNVRSLNATLGVAAAFNLSNKIVDKVRVANDVIVGLVYTPARDAASSYSELNENVFSSGGSEFVTDTAYFQNDAEGTMTIPQRINLGLSWRRQDAKERTWLLSADLKMQDWSAFQTDFDFLSEITTLQAYRQTSVGLEVTPRPMSDNSNAWLRGSYRVGVRMADSYLTVRENSLSEWAVSSGISLPILNSGSTSKFHFGIEFGSRGTTPNKLVEETFVHAFAGFSFSPISGNPWFKQRKYD